MIGLFLVSTALANGQTTHMWISHEAVENLPEGDLRSLLEVPENWAALENGTMFPDGGYATDHPYGETAHWEPFQGLLRDWILETFEDPLAPEAGETVAFYLGMASHGMADQVFDALYMERSKQLDAEEGWSSGQSLDVSSDIVWAWETGAQVPPEPWYPPILVALFDEVGIEVDTDTLDLGQKRLGLAIDFVGTTGQIASGVQEHTAHFPWACTHMTDRTIPGGPYSEAEIIAAYWEALWDELLGEALPLEVLASFPKEGGRALHREADDVESRLSLVFSRSLLKSEVAAAGFALSGDGILPELEPWLFYRDNSHVLHLLPSADWSENADYSLALEQGLEATDGRLLESDWTLHFSTKAFEDPRDAGCSCASSSRASGGAWTWMLGVCAFFRRRQVA